MGWFSDFVDHTVGIITDPIGALEAGVHTVGNIIDKAMENPLRTAALIAAGAYFAPSIGAWLTADGAVAATAAEAAAADAAAGVAAADTAAAEAANAVIDLGATDASLGAAGAVNAAEAAAGLAPVVDAVPTIVNANLPEATIASGLKSLGSAAVESLGLGGMSAGTIAALAAAGALAPSVLKALGLTGGTGSKGTTYGAIEVPKVGVAPPLVSGGVNPGLLTAAPAYTPVNPQESTYYWGKQPYVATTEDIKNLNSPAVVGTHGWAPTVQPAFDVNAYIRNTINPKWDVPSVVAPQPVVAATPIVTPVNNPINPADVIAAVTAATPVITGS